VGEEKKTGTLLIDEMRGTDAVSFGSLRYRRKEVIYPAISRGGAEKSQGGISRKTMKKAHST